MNDWYGGKCDVFCTNATCSNRGTCQPSNGKCLCEAGSLFSMYVYGGPKCELVVNLSLVAIIIGFIAIGLLCGGIGLCCACEKMRSPRPKDRVSLLKGAV